LKDEENNLRLTASYAFQERKGFSGRFKPGESLVGQCAKEKKMILFSEVPDDYIFIGSGLGKSAPKYILVYPLLFEGEVLGVVELAYVKKLSELQIKFVETVTIDIAITISSASFNSKLQILLDTTRKQSEDLQKKQIEVQQNNAELEQQAEILRINESQLQQQTEELQSMNEVLEEKTQMLEEQKEEIENKNRNLNIKQTELERQTRELEQATRYKSEFLANMSHELRTPLNSMLLLAKMMSDNEENNLTPDQIESSQSIYRSGQNLLRLINDILDLSKIEANKIELSITTCRIRELVRNITAEFKHSMQEKGLELQSETAPDLPEFFKTDLLRIEQIIRNFMSNAMKFTEQGSVKLYLHRPTADMLIRRKDLPREKCIAVSVTDTGIGIPTDKQQIIFEAFKQVDGSISRKYGGTGLGMSIAKELANLIGGEIHIDSKVNEGTTFTLLIPEELNITELKTVKHSSTDYAPISRPPESTRLPVFKNEQEKLKPQVADKIRSENTDTISNSSVEKTMLIIEDDEEFARVLKTVSEKKGYQCHLVGDGENGIKFAIKNKPTAIILDIGLPGIDGWAVMDELKNNSETRHIPVHIMSAYDKSEFGMQKGAIGYFTKPVSKEQLDEAFAKIESIATDKVKELLIVEDDAELRRSIIKLLKSSDVNITAVGKGYDALKEIKAKKYHTMILDLGLPDISGFELLDKIIGDENIEAIPVVIYTGRDLNQQEKEKLKKYTSSVVLKNANSTDKLLDETALFLHRVESELPPEQQKIIRKMLDKESILKNKKVLIVDDDMRNAFALSKYLKSKMMTPLIANNGEKALAELDKNSDVDIVLMDIMMPVMDGYEAITQIRAQERFKSLPILALTAKALETDRRKAIECGANDYLTKPVDVDKLISLLRIWIYQKN